MGIHTAVKNVSCSLNYQSLGLQKNFHAQWFEIEVWFRLSFVYDVDYSFISCPYMGLRRVSYPLKSPKCLQKTEKVTKRSPLNEAK